MKFGMKCGVHLLVALVCLAAAQDIQYVYVYVTQVGGSYYRNHTFPLSGSPYIVTHEIIVGEEATLTIEAGVEILFDEGVGMTVVGQLHAVGSADKRIVLNRKENPPDDPIQNITRDPNVRLVGPTVNQGRLEIRHDGLWGSVCHNRGWRVSEAKVACRHLGFATGTVRYQNGDGKGRVSMSDLSCFGNEQNLYGCTYRQLGTAPNCDSGGSLGVVCEGISRVNSVFWNGIRLVPSSAGKVSILEHVDVLHAGQDDGTGTTAAINIETYPPVLRDVNVKYSAGAGVKIQGATTEVNMADCSLEENFGPGIIIEDQETNINLQNTRFSKNFPYGAQVIRGTPGHKITITDSAFTENFGTGLLLDTVKREVTVVSSNFSSNTHFGLGSVNSQMSALLIQSCTLNSNGLDGVFMQQAASTLTLSKKSFSIDQSSVSGNLRRGVTASIYPYSYNNHDQRTFFNVTGSEVSSNIDGAIDIKVERSTQTLYPSFLLDNSVFKANGGDVVSISGSLSNVEVRNNVFQENTCGSDKVLVFTGQGKNVSCSSNTFQQNHCKRLGLFSVTEHAYVNNTEQTFTANVFTDNDYDPPFLYKSDPLRDYCTLEFSGEWRPISVTHNSFQQDASRFDLCSTVSVDSWDGPSIEATHNWWGTDDEEVIRRKIFDYSDWNSGAQVTYSPFLDSANGNPVSTTGYSPSALAFGGVLTSDLHITKGSSPVLMKSDLTILHGATLTLDPGVEVKAAPGAGILNYGHINMVGSASDQVILGAQINDNIASKDNHLRLSGNDRLEVFHDGTWKSVCYDWKNWGWGQNTQALACQQLGLGPLRSFGGTSFGALPKVVVRCDGNEESFQQCIFYDLAPDNLGCSYQASICCEPTPGWGGIRSHGQDKTKVEHILFKDIGQLHKIKSSALTIDSVDSAMTLQNVEIERCLQSRAGVEILGSPSHATVQHVTASACEAETVLHISNATDSVTINSVSITATGRGTLGTTVGIHVASLDMTNSGPTVAIFETTTSASDYGMKLTGGQGKITVQNSEARSNDHGVRIERWTGDVEFTQFDGYRRAIRFHRNVFENPLVNHQVCSNIPSRSAEDFVDGRYNWWGTAIKDNIRDTIFDFDEHNDHAGVVYVPYLTSSDVTMLPSTNPVSSPTMPLPLLGGRLYSDLHLAIDNSPYTLTSDLTILPSVTLTIDPGVEIQAYPCVGLLNLGTLVANGTKQQPITFGPALNIPTAKPSLYRLTDGRYPWEGKVEVFFQGRWYKVCSTHFNGIDILCRELGYGPSTGNSGYTIGLSEESVTSAYYAIDCEGDEEKLVHCYRRATVFTRTQCSSRRGLFARCLPVSTHSTIPDSTCTSNAWGGLRMASDESFVVNHVDISGSGTLHSKPASGLSIEKSGGEISNVLIKNCTGSGLEIFGAGSDTNIIGTDIYDCQANTGIAIYGSQSEVHVSRATVTNSTFVTGGVSLSSWDAYVDRENFENVIGICDSEEDVFLTAGAYFMYETKSGQCVKHIHAGQGQEIHLQVVVASRRQLRVYSDVNQQHLLGEVNSWSQNTNRVFHSPEVISLDVMSSGDDVYLEVQITRMSAPSRRTVTDSVLSNNHGTVVNVKTITESEITISRSWLTSNTPLTLDSNDLTAAIVVDTKNTHCAVQNNYVFNNSMKAVEFRSSGNSELFLVHNVFDTNQGNGAVSLTVDGLDTSQALIFGNDFVSNDAPDYLSIMTLKNTPGKVRGNHFQRNIGLYIVDWGVRGGSSRGQNFTGNRLEHNSGQRPGYKHTVAVSGPNVHLNQNVLNNPANDAELIALNNCSSAAVDATNNWWGSDQATEVAERIRDRRDRPELPDVLFEPFLEEDPEKGVCRYSWFHEEQLGYCYKYKGAAQTLDYAWDSCKEQYAQVVMKASDKELQMLSAALKNQVDDGNFAPEPFWMDQEISSDEQACRVYRQNAGVSDVLPTQCDSLYPYFCKLPASRGCPNDCSQHGACQVTGTGAVATCYCDRGWDGADCSQPNCQDLDDCGEFGVCVGPNVCRCRNGWQGRGCTVSYCSRFSTCKSCVRSVGCGWCDQTQSCESGLYGGPDVIPCPTWFYHNCFTVGNKGLCSGHIEVVDCESRQCNTSLTGTTVESCLRCEDVEGCFMDTEDGYCKVWDQSRCPKGFVYPLYNDTTRIEKILTAHNVKYVPSDGDPLYHCRVRFSSWGATLFIQEGELDVQLGQVLSSPQAGGVLHKVEQVVTEGAYTLVAAHPATLEDMFNYADFSQSVRLEPVVDFSSIEQEPSLSVIQSVIRGNGTFQGDNTHVINPDVRVYKCVGPSGSLRLVFRESDPNLPVINPGDVIVGNQSNGMLEFVTKMSNTAFGTVLHTNLADCPGGIYSIQEEFETVSGHTVPPPLSCSGGPTGETGLLIAEKRDLPLQPGSVVVGRKTGRFAAKVLSKRVNSGFIVMETEPITIGTSELQTTPTSAGNSAMRWDIAAEDVVMERAFHLKASVNASFTADIGLSDTLSMVGYRRRTLEKAEVQFIGGNVEIELAGEAETFRRFLSTYHDSLLLQTNKEKVRVCIMDDVCIPGEKWASVSLEYALYASSAGTLKMSGTVSKPDIDAFAGWSPQDGSRWFQFDQNEEASSARISIASYEGGAQESDKFVVMEMVATPTFYLDLPVRDETEADTATAGLQQLFGNENEDVFPYRMTASVEAKALLRTSTETCSQACPHADRPQRVGVTSQLDYLKGRFEVDLFTVVHSEEKEWRDGTWMDSDLYCAAQTTDINTCAKVCHCPGGEASLPHPTDTSVCQCPCICPDGTVSFTHPDGPGGCNCERCPDGSMKVPDPESGRLRCPCLCADNSTREMVPGGNGECDCSCECADGSSDVIAADGRCPCSCSCNNCQESVLGPDGCLCSDSCPDCENGEEPVWVGCSCKCPQKTECGAPPTCVVGRMGVDCRQPDCRPCQDCSGNGWCVSSADSCQSSCVCGAQWFGDCCELRRPRPVGGDPHLETLDGRPFDYHGIGEFWDCRSPENDFGVQTRMFAYSGASLIGAAAVKTGHSVVTITTPEHATESDLPNLRIDGSLQPVSSGQKYVLNNGTVHLLVDIPRTRGSQSGEVVLFSFTFESGASVTFDIRLSPSMGRQYLNIIFSPTAAFKEKTQGLCGYMDGVKDNDFRGPDGTLHRDAASFAESLRR
ncbi:uncharacterized protein LOC144922161 [Branchiostoma floridae x Branchiostoma belcheri]